MLKYTDMQSHDEPQESPKLPKKSKCGQGKIPVKVAAKAKLAYIEGASLSEICRRYPQYSRDQFRWMRDREGWDRERSQFIQELESSNREALQTTKSMLLAGIIKTANQCARTLMNGGMQIESIKDLYKLCGLLGMIQMKDNLLKPDADMHRVFTPEQMSRLLDYVADRRGIPIRPETRADYQLEAAPTTS